MRKSVRLLVLVLLVALTACGFERSLPETVAVNGSSYRLLFSGTLYPADDPDSIEMTYTDEKINYYPLEHADFDCIVIYDNAAEPNIYCVDDQWEEMKRYYEDPQNFTYYYTSGNMADPEDRHEYEISNTDIDKFNELLLFAFENDYQPLNLIQKDAETRMIPLSDSDDWTQGEMHLYKISNDGYFSTQQGHIFRIEDGEVVLVWYYDWEDDAAPMMKVVDVPDELEDYFIELVNNIS